MTDTRALVEAALKPRVDAAKLYMPTFSNATDLVLARPDIIYWTDSYGDTYLDFTSGAGVMPLGWAYRRMYEASADQLDCYSHAAELGQTTQFWEAEYAKRISETFPAKDGVPQQVLYTGSGDRAKAIASYLVSGNRGAIRTLYDGHELTADDAALVVEFCSPTFEVYNVSLLHEEVKRAKSLGVPVIAVETNTGFGRCGTLWAQEEWRVEADITVLGEAGGGGFAWGAIVADPKYFAAVANMEPLVLPGNEIACAAGNVLLSEITEPILENVRDTGYVLEAGLAGLVEDFPPLVASFRGIGLNYALVLESPAMSKAFIAKCREAGVITSASHRRPEVMRMTPPLIISDLELRRGVDRIGSALMDLSQEN